MVEDVVNKSALILKKHKQYLAIFTSVLNTIHKVNYSSRFWDILFGAWLIKMIPSVYDKYLALTSADINWRDNSSKPQLTSNKIPPFWKIVAHEPFEFLKEWNLYVNKYIQYLGAGIKNIDLLMREELLFAPDESRVGLEQKTEYCKLQMRAYIFRRKNRFKEIGITTNYEYFLKKNVKDALNQQLLESKKVLFIEEWDKYFKYEFVPTKKLRGDFRALLYRYFNDIEEFDKIFFLFLVEAFPVHFLEGFSHRSILTELARDCQLRKCIVFNDLFDSVNQNFFVAGQVELNKSKLVEIGHGGSGFTRGNLLRLWGHGVLDNFVTPGCSIVVSNAKDIEFYALKSLNLETKHENFIGPNLRVLYVTTIYVPHSNFFIIASPECVFPEKYLLGMRDFINHFLERKDHFLEWRPFLSRMNRQDEHVERVLQGIATESQGRLSICSRDSFYSRLELVDVYVTDHFSTTILEAFTYDIPVVAFWDEIFDDYSVDVRARAIMKKMRQVNILHANATQAAEFLHDKITVQTWWKNQEVIAVKEEFKELFYRTSPHTLSSFVNFILSSPSLD